jgi:hypothetical protein
MIGHQQEAIRELSTPALRTSGLMGAGMNAVGDAQGDFEEAERLLGYESQPYRRAGSGATESKARRSEAGDRT